MSYSEAKLIILDELGSLQLCKGVRVYGENIQIYGEMILHICTKVLGIFYFIFDKLFNTLKRKVLLNYKSRSLFS